VLWIELARGSSETYLFNYAMRSWLFGIRKHIADGRCASVSSDDQRRFLEAFVGATQKGDLVTLESFFAEDVAV
jgi:RNA polymerase sigma-70 factor (ECF subfamily)